MSISKVPSIHISPAPRALRRVVWLALILPLAAVTAKAHADDRVPAGGTLSLARAEAIALEHQPTVAEAVAQTEASEGRVEEARAGYLPQATISGAYQRTTGNFALRPGGVPSTISASGWTGSTYNYFNFGATASQLITDFGVTSGRWRAAAASRDAARDNERTLRVQTLLGVRRAYLQARAQAELAAVAEQSMTNQRKHVEQTQGFVRAGMRPDIDLARVRTDLANAKVQLVNANNALTLARATLNQAMGLPQTTVYELAEEDLPAVAGEADSLDGLIAQAVKGRPELVNLTDRRRAQELTLQSVKGGYGPSLSATAGATEAGTELGNLVPNWFVGLSASWQILQGGLTRGQVREAKGTLAALTASEQTLLLQIRVDVEQAQLGVMAAKSTISAAEEALVNARELLRLAERRYETGLGSAIELGDAQVAATAAAAQEVTARFSLGTARAQLLAALGVA